MVACGSLQHIFEKPRPENPTLLESFSSWKNQLNKPVTPVNQSSVTEIFGELHFKDNSQSSFSSSSSSSSSQSSFSSSSSSSSSSSLSQSSFSSSSSSSSPLLSFPLTSFASSSSSSSSTFFIDVNPRSTGASKLNSNDGLQDSSFSTVPKNLYTGCHKKGDGFSPMNFERLQLCTEGLGFESSDDVEDLKNNMNEDWKYQEERSVSIRRHHSAPENSLGGEFRRASKSSGGAFPPPISCIGKSGKPWVCFKSYRQDGRFVLKQVRIPNQELLHACREDGRLTLHFVQPNDEILDEEEEEDEDEDEDEEEEFEEENCAYDDNEEENEEKSNDEHYDINREEDG